ncbi:MAG: hypothetical protein AVDCRST_MAG18-1664 [uncultured Thermomicrobiales bacterium]|uniref:Uncharacterized protein n=1 Tax=uncultured Thermomicrobiales bacterium TaxID=1645740 RepID=A0A6J4V3M9_9BACT|nr:MAG: hypothetical protein AVDCRST_MAG18-1664 [uncultured Thermomicrobiales bacterium]
MSGLMRGMIDQVLKNMGEDERAQSVNYVTDRMVERMSNEERIALLMAILDRVMSNLSPEERAELAGRVVGTLSAAPAATTASMREEADPLLGGGEMPTGGQSRITEG